MKLKSNRKYCLRRKKTFRNLKVKNYLNTIHEQFIKQKYGSNYVEETVKYKRMFERIKTKIIKEKTKNKLKFSLVHENMSKASSSF